MSEFVLRLINLAFSCEIFAGYKLVRALVSGSPEVVVSGGPGPAVEKAALGQQQHVVKHRAHIAAGLVDCAHHLHNVLLQFILLSQGSRDEVLLSALAFRKVRSHTVYTSAQHSSYGLLQKDSQGSCLTEAMTRTAFSPKRHVAVRSMPFWV